MEQTKTIFKNFCPSDYVKVNSRVKSKIKAVIHGKNGSIKGYHTLKELKEDNPQFKHLKKCYVDIKGFLHKIYCIK